MDRDGAIKLLDAARSAGIEQYVIVSSIGAENPPADDDVFSIYLRAKAEADRALMKSDRAWTIVRPGHLTDDPGTGRVRIDVEPAARERQPRPTSRASSTPCCTSRGPLYLILYVIAGEDPIEEALDRARAVTP